MCLVAQSCPTLFDPMDPPVSSVHGDSPGKNTGVGCHALLQGIFSTQGSNPGLPHCRRILYCLSHHGKWLFYWLKFSHWPQLTGMGGRQCGLAVCPKKSLIFLYLEFCIYFIFQNFLILYWNIDGVVGCSVAQLCLIFATP